jgi:hypothetical protein
MQDELSEAVRVSESVLNCTVESCMPSEDYY